MWHTPDEIAATFKLNVATVRRMLARGELEGTKLAGQWRVSQEDLDAWIERGRRRPKQDPGVLRPSSTRSRVGTSSNFARRLQAIDGGG